MKKMLSVILSLVVLSTVYTPDVSAAEIEKRSLVTAPIMAPVTIGNYITFNGIIEEVTEQKDHYMITAKALDDEDNKMVLRVFDETTVLSQSLMSSVARTELTVGKKISASYGVNTPVSMSLPPQLNPEVVIIMDNEDMGKVKTDVFSTQRMVSSDNMLALNISDATVIADTNGAPVDKADISNGTLVVFYSIETRSIPPQTSPEKIIVLKRGEVDKPTDSKQAQADLLLQLLSGEQLEERNGVKYARLIDVAMHLGYEVSWNGQKMEVTLQNGSVTFSLTIGEAAYTHNLEMGHFQNAPIVINDRTFIEEQFIKNLILDETIVE